MNIVNNRGPRVKPWGRPGNNGEHDDNEFSSLICWLMLLKYLVNNFTELFILPELLIKQ